LIRAASSPRQRDLEAQVVQQVQFAIQEADLILWIVDAQTGLLGEDFALQAWLHRNLPPEKPLWLVVNKSDDPAEGDSGV
jgi:predicted GTPase